MTKKNTVSIQINKNKLLSNLEYSFSNSRTVLGELMQNARRAGATKIHFQMEDESKKLEVIDNGCGIADFQNLLSVADSGWDESTVANERPFGMGWLSCLYAADEINVISNGRYISGLSNEILSGTEIEVKDYDFPLPPDTDNSYTILRLAGFSLNIKQVLDALKTLSYGFPIEVYFNGELLSNPQQVNSELNFMKVEGLGDVCVMPFEQHGKMNIRVNSALNVYLQGLPVYSKTSAGYITEVDSNHYPNVVHLDSKLFFGRLPDRDQLIDEREVIAKINATINDIYLSRLVELKEVLLPEEFATRDIYEFALNVKGGFELFCDKEVRLPNLHYGPIDSVQPSCCNDHGRIERGNAENSYSYDDLKSGKVNVCVIADMETYEVSNAAAWIFAIVKDWDLLDIPHHNNLPEKFEKHWINEFVHDVNNDNIEVEIIGEILGKRGTIMPEYWESSCEVVLCESYKLTYTEPSGKKHDVVVHTHPLYTKDGLMLIPAGASHVNDAVLQGGDYMSDNDFQDDDFEVAGTALNLFVETLRSGNEVSALEQLLNTVWLGEYSAFKGSKYELLLDDNCKIRLNKIAA